MDAILIILGIVILIIAGVVSRFIIIFYRNGNIADKKWETYKPEKIREMGSVNNFTLLPIVDWYVKNESFSGEAGVAWLVQVDNNKILLDVGLNLHNEEESPLMRNMAVLNINTEGIDKIFISHLHVDHVGGLAAQKGKTIRLTNREIDLSHATLYVPTPMVHPTANIELIEGPKVLMPGVASEGPISRSLFIMGMIEEQALVVNVKDKGLILIVGCGHQGLKRIFERAESVFDIPIYGLIGGLHYPVTDSKIKLGKLPMQKILGTGKLSWQNITKNEVEESIEYLKSKNLRLLSISAHDSCDWTVEKFRKAFKDIYVDLKVGEPINIS